LTNQIKLQIDQRINCPSLNRPYFAGAFGAESDTNFSQLYLLRSASDFARETSYDKNFFIVHRYILSFTLL